MKRASRAFVASALLVVGLIAVPVPAEASDQGAVAAALVSESSYRHYLDDMLYTHDGDARGLLGPEHDLARDNIEMLFNSFGLSVELHPFEYYGQTYYNVIATKTGTLYPDQEYIIGAHYDSAWFEYPDIGSPGADDNASGVALVLEAARIISAFDSDYTIRFMAFDREEQGLVGARAWADDHITNDILGMISADMVAYNKGTNTVDIFGLSTSEPIKTALADAVAAYGDGLIPSVGGASSGSDHWAFEERGFVACLMIEDWGNPYYHDDLDSVDTPDYIDYAYATRMTRSAVGWLVDAAGVDVPIPDGDYDGSGLVDMADYDAFVDCYSGADVAPGDSGCLFFDFDSDGDVDCVDWDLFVVVWDGPGDPPAYATCNPLAPTADGPAGRYLTVAAPGQGVPVALLVTGDPDDPVVSCVSQYVQADGGLGATPVFQTPEEWGTVLVWGEAIRPETSYHIHCDYGSPGNPLLSPATAEATTRVWGDTVGPYDSDLGVWTPPDGSPDVIDIVAIIDRFRSLPDAPPVHWVDLVGVGATGPACYADGNIDMVDASAGVDGFKRIPYDVSTGCPDLCP
jgi:hypothetical protein